MIATDRTQSHTCTRSNTRLSTHIPTHTHTKKISRFSCSQEQLLSLSFSLRCSQSRSLPVGHLHCNQRLCCPAVWGTVSMWYVASGGSKPLNIERSMWVGFWSMWVCWGYAELLEKVMHVCTQVQRSWALLLRVGLKPDGVLQQVLLKSPAYICFLTALIYHTLNSITFNTTQRHTLVLNLSGSQSFSSCLHCRSADTLKTSLSLSTWRWVTIIHWVKKKNWKLLVLWSEADK